MVNIIRGVTKSGIHVDRKKEANKTAAREKVEIEETCKQCGFPLDEEEQNAQSLGGHEEFCSWTCFDYYTETPGE